MVARDNLCVQESADVKWLAYHILDSVTVVEILMNC